MNNLTAATMVVAACRRLESAGLRVLKCERATLDMELWTATTNDGARWIQRGTDGKWVITRKDPRLAPAGTAPAAP